MNPIKRLSPNYNDRPATAIDMLVLHYTGMETCQAALDRLCDPAAQVSAHYLIDEDGALYQMVEEKYRAWHAGMAEWRDISDVNGHSIGIELVNPGHEFGYRLFPDAQVLSLINLCIDILGRHTIPAQNVLGHSDVAPERKEDPGELFDWRRLANEGIGEWPKDIESVTMNEDDTRQYLNVIGYGTSNLQATLSAFQRRYRSNNFDGVLDAETGGLITNLAGIFQ